MSAGTPSGEPIDRRAALKKALVAGAATGIVWSAPKIHGLTLRPNYAAAATGSGTVTVMYTANGDFVNPGTFACCGVDGNLAFTATGSAFTATFAGGTATQIEWDAAPSSRITIGPGAGETCIDGTVNPGPPFDFMIPYNCEGIIGGP